MRIIGKGLANIGEIMTSIYGQGLVRTGRVSRLMDIPIFEVARFVHGFLQDRVPPSQLSEAELERFRQERNPNGVVLGQQQPRLKALVSQNVWEGHGRYLAASTDNLGEHDYLEWIGSTSIRSVIRLHVVAKIGQIAKPKSCHKASEWVDHETLAAGGTGSINAEVCCPVVSTGRRQLVADHILSFNIGTQGCRSGRCDLGRTGGGRSECLAKTGQQDEESHCAWIFG